MKVLVVEDHQDARTMLARILCGWGHEVETVDRLQPALEVVRTRPFDVIVSDIALPDGSGYALMNCARHIGSRALAIALSAYPYPSAIAEPGVTGFDHYLSKPLDAARLRQLLDDEAECQRTEDVVEIA